MMTNVHCFLVFVAQLFPVMGARGTREAVHHGLYQQAAVPVIHLDPGKATVDDYLRMFPEKFLASNKRIKPIDVRKIEHEDFIDYEIEFIELSQDDSVDEARTEEFIFKQTDESDSFLDNLNSKVSSDKDQNYSLSEDSKEVNLVNYDLTPKTIKSSNPRTRGGDIRRRRRIKLKRDPARTNTRPREINDASNQIDTSQQSKRVENNFSHSFYSKPRTVLRNLIQIPETERKATLLDRRTLQTPPHHRPTNFRSRKRIPHKFGRSFSHDDKPSDQLIRLRNPAIITKLERSNHIERNVIKSKDKSRDNLDDKPSEAEEDLVGHVTSERQNMNTFPILTETTDSAIQGDPNKSTLSYNNIPVTEPETDMNKPGDVLEIKPQSKLITEERLSLLPPSQTMDEAKTSAAETFEGDVDPAEDISTLDEREKSPSLYETIVPLRITTTTSVQTPTTTTMTTERTTTPLMMYPDVFTQQPDIVQTLQPRTNSLPFHLLSVFGSKPRSSRLQISKSRNPSPEISVSWSESVSRDPESDKPEIVSVFSNMQQITTVSSAFKFSIISTSTETSAPLYPTTTPAQIVSVHQLKLHKTEQVLPSQSAAKTSATKSTTISLPAISSTLRTAVISTTKTTTTASTSTTTSSFSTTEVTSDTIDTNQVADTTSHSTFKTLLKTELFDGITTPAGVESIMDDNQMMTTPIPEDLQLSESITSVYLHNSSMQPSFTNNIKTTETPKIDTVNSITLLPFSKLTNQILDSDRKDSRTDIRQQQEAVNVSDENVYTVTPVSVTLIPTTVTEMHYNDDDYDVVTDVTDTNDDQQDIIQTTTLDPMTEMYSGHYHEENPGQYHEVNPGQYHEINPGQYHEVNPGQYHEVNPGQYDETQHQSVKYQNLESTYPGGYEVNEVKVDFDNRDEHKIYNVQAKAGDFIIGEVGKIDVNNGQTVEGVRYTALDGEVDPLKIAEILNRYFGTRTS